MSTISVNQKKLNSLQNVQIINSYINNWNITKRSGTNIIGGLYLGGNFWARPNGTGFSQKCEDGDGDGICDLSHSLDSTNFDHLSLVYTPVHNINKGTNYPTIQSAINDSSPGDEIQVDSGFYFENVNVTRQLTLRGIGNSVVDARGNASAVTLAADGITLSGFTVTGGASYSGAGIKIISNNNTLMGNKVLNNGNAGIVLISSSNNVIYNNIFNNTENVQIINSNINNWNITKQTGTNIIGGLYLGGNFWAKPDGAGFSQKCDDGNMDGICDLAYALDSDNIDYLPFSIKGPIHNINKGANYTTIQSAINYASPGDEIHVDSGIYYENVNVSKPLTLRGESNLTTIIQGNGIGNVVEVNANGIVIDGFRIRNGSNGIYVNSSSNVISNNVIMDLQGGANNSGTGGMSSGIYFFGSTNNTLRGNTISNITGGAGGNGSSYSAGFTGGLSSGIYLSSSTNNTITGNAISNIMGGMGGRKYREGADQEGYGIFLKNDSYQNLISPTNTVDGDPIIYLYAVDGAVIENYVLIADSNPTNLGKIVLINSSNSIIRNNTISNMTGEAGELGGSGVDLNGVISSLPGGSGGISSGIYLSGSKNNTLTGNKISNMTGGTGGKGGRLYTLGGSGGSGGISSGIFLSGSRNNTLSGNNIYNITGGKGGVSGDIIAGDGGSGGISSGIYLFYSPNNNITGNTISNMTGGMGKRGGDWGDGGTGGLSSGISLSGSPNNTLNINMISNILGGLGGGGGLDAVGNGDGGAGGTGGLSSGIDISDSLYNTLIGNTISNVKGGTGGGGGGDSNDGPYGSGGLSSGIYFTGSTSNNLTDNKLGNIIGGEGGYDYYRGSIGYPQEGYGIYLENDSYQNEIYSTNTLDGDPILYLYEADGAVIENYVLIANRNPTNLGKIVLINSSNTIIRNNTISNMTGEMGKSRAIPDGGPGGISSGIYLSGSKNNTLTGNTISNIIGGIGGTGRNRGTAGGMGGLSSGIYLSDSLNNNLTGNTISNMTGGKGGTRGAGWDPGPYGIGGLSSGIYFSGSTNNTLRENIISNIIGVEGDYDNNNRPIGDPQEGYGIYLEKDSYQNVIYPTNIVDGNSIVYLYDVDGVVIENHVLTANSNPTNLGKIVLINSSNTIIRNNTISNMIGEAGETGVSDYSHGLPGGSGVFSSGIYLSGSINNTLTGNTISNITGGRGGTGGYQSSGGSGGFSSGIYLSGSKNNSLTSNTISNITGGEGGRGYYYQSGSSGGFSSGIYLSDSANNSLRGNTISNMTGGTGGTGYSVGSGGLSSGIYLSGSINNSLATNTINNITGGTGGAGDSYSSGGSGGLSSGISLSGSINNSLKGNTISNMTGGTGGSGTPGGSVGLSSGIYLSESINNTLIDNSASNNNHSIYLNSSSNNNIYHNNFINNTNQAYDDSNNNLWDSGYPSGGNYWSDYTGVDLKRGPSQNVPYSDDIGDTPYNISGGGGAQDRYPQMYKTGQVHNINKGTNYFRIQAAINDASPGDEIRVDTRTYHENVNVTKQLILRGIGMPVVDGKDLDSKGTAITLAANGITLEGFTATGGGQAPGAGIYVISNNNTLIGNNAYNSAFGIYLLSSNNNTLIGNNVSNNRNNGIYLSSSINNKIYNNIFNNTNNVQFISNLNTWNITRQLGTNIIDGLYLGGNFWAKPNGTGFSQKCDDANSDGICDLVFALDSTNIDYLPLAYITQPEKQITSDPNNQSYPDIDGNRIVWEDNRNGNWDIYMDDLSTGIEKQITNNTSTQWNSAISGNRIVWDDERNGNFDIYMYDLSTSLETRITNNIADQAVPDIDGNRIVWVDERNGNSDIYLYDLSTNTETRITSNIANQYSPAISQNRIVWEDNRNGNLDIYMYNLSSLLENRITTNLANQEVPSIDKNRIVWQDQRNGNYDIYMYDLSTSIETRITTNPANQKYPAISGNRIAYMDDRNGNMDIYLYDLSTGNETQITSNPALQRYPAISGNRIVWGDFRNVNRDIYMYTIASALPFLTSIEVSPPTKNLTVGDNFTFTPTPKDQYGAPFSTTVTWSSSNATVGTVNASGKFIALNPGTAMVNATNGSFTGTAIVTVNPDIIPPASITNLTNRSYALTYINWTWTDPKELDFDHVEVYIDNILKENVPKAKQFYNATGFNPGTEHTIATRTSDTKGNINQTWVNATARTLPSGAAPVAVCGPDKPKCENVGAPVQFNGSASYDPDGAVVSYYWDFGDGTNATGAEPKHTYVSSQWNGTAYEPFIVNLTVTDDKGLTNSTSQKVVIWMAGDANGDGKVNILDASVVGLKWNGNDPCSDLNNDGNVNILDANIIELNWGKIA